jgi:carnitine 3-dehydrogenase
VRIFDPDPEAFSGAEAVYERALRCFPGLYDSPLPDPGRAMSCSEISAAVSEASWVQESVPERMELKRKVIERVQASTPPDAVVASSSSGLTLDDLKGCALVPEQIVAVRPLHPVYLVPFVEVAGTGAAGEAALAMMRNLLMSPLERDPEDSPGLAQALLGELVQLPGDIRSSALGPLLGVASAATAEERDAALVGLFRGLKVSGTGFGANLNDADRKLEVDPGPDSGPMITSSRRVPPDWSDYNGHMTEARYLHAFGDATDRFMELIGCDADYIENGGSFFTAETHIRHLGELNPGDRIEIRTTCLDATGKRMHLWHEMWNDDRLCATGEHMLIHVDMASRRPAPPGPRLDRLRQIAAAHADLPRPEGMGRAIGDPR